MDDKAALKMMQYLLKEEPGALKILNHFHACTDQLVTDATVFADMHVPPENPEEQVAGEGEYAGRQGNYSYMGQSLDGAKPGPIARQCADYAREHGHTPGIPGGYQSIGHYRLHDVKRLEEAPNKKGVYVAYADDELGTQCGGLPSALLARLTEHARS